MTEVFYFHVSFHNSSKIFVFSIVSLHTKLMIFDDNMKHHKNPTDLRKIKGFSCFTSAFWSFVLLDFDNKASNKEEVM